jgi:hypothetical protein
VVVVVVLDQKQIATVSLQVSTHPKRFQLPATSGSCSKRTMPQGNGCKEKRDRKHPELFFDVHIHHCWECHQSTMKQDNQF